METFKRLLLSLAAAVIALSLFLAAAAALLFTAAAAAASLILLRLIFPDEFRRITRLFSLAVRSWIRESKKFAEAAYSFLSQFGSAENSSEDNKNSENISG